MNIIETKNMIRKNQLQDTWITLYGESFANSQSKRYLEAIETFQQYFQLDDRTEIHLYSVPGRIEISGNHTDHQQGKVIAASVQMDIIGVVAKTDDAIIIKSQGYDEESIHIHNLEIQPEECNTSASLIRGILKYFQDAHYNTGGFKAYLTSDILKGSGLSSSAAYENMVGTILNYEYNQGAVELLSIAKAGQYAENVYFGKPSGLMDQAASAIGGLIAIDFFKKENPVVHKLPNIFAHQPYTICIIDTKGNHADMTDDYASIPNDMKKISASMGKKVLSEVDESLFYRNIPRLRQEHGDRAVIRAIHFFNENQRVSRQTEFLKERRFLDFLQTVKDSGLSSFCYLQNIFSVHTPNDQGLSLALAVTEKILGESGAYRVHGGGFAGTILSITPDHLLDQYEQAIHQIFGKNSCHKLGIRSIGAHQVH